MVRQESKLNVADNSGAKIVQCLRVLGGSKKKYATIGDKIVVSVKKAAPKGGIKKKEVALAVVVRTKKESRRRDGTYIRFSDNAVAIIDKSGQPRSTRILGPIGKEVRTHFNKVASLAKEIY